MCLNKLHTIFENCDDDSETKTTDNWQDIFDIYLLKLEHETKTTLRMIKDDLKRKGLKFGQQLKDSLVHLTNARVSQAYVEFGILNKCDAELLTKHSERNCKDVESKPKMIATDVCERDVSINESCDKYTNDHRNTITSPSTTGSVDSIKSVDTKNIGAAVTAVTAKIRPNKPIHTFFSSHKRPEQTNVNNMLTDEPRNHKNSMCDTDFLKKKIDAAATAVAAASAAFDAAESAVVNKLSVSAITSKANSNNAKSDDKFCMNNSAFDSNDAHSSQKTSGKEQENLQENTETMGASSHHYHDGSWYDIKSA